MSSKGVNAFFKVSQTSSSEYKQNKVDKKLTKEKRRY